MKSRNKGPQDTKLKQEISSRSTPEVVMDEHIALNAGQAEGLRFLYESRRDIEEKIVFAHRMLGIQGRQIVSGDLGSDNAHLVVKSLENGASD